MTQRALSRDPLPSHQIHTLFSLFCDYRNSILWTFTNHFPFLCGLAFVLRTWLTGTLARQTGPVDSPRREPSSGQSDASLPGKANSCVHICRLVLQAPGSPDVPLKLTWGWGGSNAFLFPRDAGLVHPEDVEDFWKVLEVSQNPDLLAVSKVYCGTFKIYLQNLWHSFYKRKRPTLLPLNTGLT